MSDRGFRTVFWSLIALGLLDRIRILAVTIGHASDDQAILWLAANDHALGTFHEPFFYGQNYGVMLEALLAAPFVALGADAVRSVAIAMALLAMIPYWSFAIFHVFRDERPAAMLFAAMPLLLPVEHGLNQTALNGLAVLAVFPWVHAMRATSVRSILLGTVPAIAVFVNPNALVLAGPLVLFTVLRDPSWKRTLWMIVGTLPVLAAWHLAQRFYASDPDRVMNTIFDWRMTFHPELIPEAIGRLDAHFQWLMPVLWDHGQAVFWALPIIAAVLLFQRDRAAAAAVISAIGLIVVSLCFPKTHDGSSSIFFPLSRMFLAMPLLLAWALARLTDHWRPWRWAMAAITLATITTTALRMLEVRAVFAEALAGQDELPLRVRSIASLRVDCARLSRAARSTGADMVVLLREPDAHQAQFLACACPTLEPALPPTYMPGGDRRAWRRREAAQSRRRDLLFVNGDEGAWRKAADRARVVPSDMPSLHFVKGATGPVDPLALRMGVISSSR